MSFARDLAIGARTVGGVFVTTGRDVLREWQPVFRAGLIALAAICVSFIFLGIAMVSPPYSTMATIFVSIFIVIAYGALFGFMVYEAIFLIKRILRH